jgi:hypothetical protein
MEKEMIKYYLETIEDYKAEIQKILDDMREIPDGTYEDLYFRLERDLRRIKSQLQSVVDGKYITLFNSEDTELYS